MQNEITYSGELLDDSGNLNQAGWARSQCLTYHRDAIKASKLRIKEWDYYAATNDNFGLAVTVADNGYMGIAVVTVFDFTVPYVWTHTTMTNFPLGKLKLPSSSNEGEVKFDHKGCKLLIRKKGKQRKISIKIENFHNNSSLRAELLLTEQYKDSLMIATPFDKKKHFYYNHKINGMTVKGRMQMGLRTFDFTDSPSYGVLDWGRGVWTYNNTWYWASASGIDNDHEIGFNLGYGFGNTQDATENIFYYDGVGHKLDQVTFDIPDNYEDTWYFTSNDNRLNMTFRPIIDRNSKTKILMLESDQHQVFGYFSGKVILDDGQVIAIKDLFGFAEKVKNKW